MAKQKRFLQVGGLSGILAGIIATVGVAIVPKAGAAVVWILSIPLFLALYWSLREASRDAISGGALGVAGSVMFAVSGAVEDIASSGSIRTLAGVFIGAALIAIGRAMLRSSTFRKVYGWISVIVGIITLTTFLGEATLAELFPLYFRTPLLIIWFILAGLKVYRVSKAA